MKILVFIKKILNSFFKLFNHELVRSNTLIDYYLHEYPSYEDYKNTQIFYNKQKIQNVWADEATLSLVLQEVKENFGNKEVQGLCHGSRNGFEQKFFNGNLAGQILGTDISDTASNYENSIQWDFHDVNDKWINKFDFIYTNSLDQSWNPKLALTTWLNQIHDKGLIFIEHTKAHGPQCSSEMDPFGVKPRVMPYVLCDWFGHDISIKIIKSVKANYKNDVWLFVIRKNPK